MKKYLLFPLCAALCLLAGCADDFPTELNHNYYQDDTPPAEPDITEQTVKLGTYNLWISNKGTGDYVWTHRRDILAQSIVNNDWDIFGFQEANSTIQSELPTLVAGKGGNYEWWFVGRDSQDGKNGEALGIAYDPDRFELSDRHYFWLSPTPDEMSYGWDEVSYHRIACCAVVTDKAYGKQFFMMVTHMPLADMARSEAAILPPPPSLSKAPEFSNESAIKYSAQAGKDEKLRPRFDLSASERALPQATTRRAKRAALSNPSPTTIASLNNQNLLLRANFARWHHVYRAYNIDRKSVV